MVGRDVTTMNSNITTNQKLSPLFSRKLRARLKQVFANCVSTPSKMEEIVIEPGLVVLRNFVSDAECQKLAEAALAMGEEGEDGFYTTDASTGRKSLNTGENRGRIYDKASRFPPASISICNEAVGCARALDGGMPRMSCTHVLLNLYTTADGLCWHRDIYENDGKSDHPVVNLCVGATCRFGFRHDDSDGDRTVLLRSGDVLLFGGPCRFIKHAVMEVYLDDCPRWMADNPFRLSFTFRDSPEVIGREDEFKYFRVKDDLVGQDDFRPSTNDIAAAKPERKVITTQQTPLGFELH